MERQGHRLLDFPRPAHSLHPQPGASPLGLDTKRQRVHAALTAGKGQGRSHHLPPPPSGGIPPKGGTCPLQGVTLLLLLLGLRQQQLRPQRPPPPCPTTNKRAAPQAQGPWATGTNPSVVDDLPTRILHARACHSTAQLERAPTGAVATDSKVAHARHATPPPSDGGRRRGHTPTHARQGCATPSHP